MRERFVVTLLLSALLGPAAAWSHEGHHHGGQEAASMEMTLKGQVVDLGLFMTRAEQKASGASASIAIAASDGKTYMLLQSHESAQEAQAYERAKRLVGQTVTMHGDMYARGGVDAIVVETLEAGAPSAAAAPESELSLFGHHLGRPEYWHVMINPIPPLGLISGAGALAASLVFPAAAEPGLVLIAAAGAAVWPTIALGQHGYDRLYDQLPPDSQKWLDVHMARGEKAQWLFYLTALLAIAALVAGRRKPGAATPLRAATLLLTLACAATAAWIAHAGGQVVHPEFREGPPTAEALKIVPPASGHGGQR